MPAEKNFENKLKQYLKDQGAWLIKYWAGAAFTKEGIPDLLICHKGSFMAIEVKAPKGRPSLLQLITLKKIREAGGIGILLYPVDLEGFKKYLNGDFNWYQNNLRLQHEWFEKLSG